MVQQKLCTEPNDNPQDAFRSAVAYATKKESVNIKHLKVEDERFKLNPCTQ